MPTIPFGPDWINIPIWVYIWGIVANLIIFGLLFYNLYQHESEGLWWNLKEFLSSNFILVVVVALIWFPWWAVVLFGIGFSKNVKLSIIPAMIGGVLGLESALVWLRREKYFPGIN